MTSACACVYDRLLVQCYCGACSALCLATIKAFMQCDPNLCPVCWDYCSTMCLLFSSHANHVLTTCTPCAGHMHSMCWPHAHHVLTTCIPCAGHMHTMCWPHAQHVCLLVGSDKSGSEWYVSVSTFVASDILVPHFSLCPSLPPSSSLLPLPPSLLPPPPSLPLLASLVCLV